MFTKKRPSWSQSKQRYEKSFTSDASGPIQKVNRKKIKGLTFNEVTRE